MPTLPATLRLDGVLLRMARPEDDAELIRLAALDSARPLAGPALVAEDNDGIGAALCLSTGRAVADPFVPSLDLVDLLRQIAARRRPSIAAPRGRRKVPRSAPHVPGRRSVIRRRRSA